MGVLNRMIEDGRSFAGNVGFTIFPDDPRPATYERRIDRSDIETVRGAGMTTISPCFVICVRYEQSGHERSYITARSLLILRKTAPYHKHLEIGVDYAAEDLALAEFPIGANYAD